MPEIPGRLRPPRIASAPATPSAGEIYYDTTLSQLRWWNGAAWMQAFGPKFTASAISGGPPASPADGDIWYATAVDVNGACWTFRYNAGSASAFKWEFIGGPPINYAKLSSGSIDTITSIQPTFANLPTTGTAAQLVVPRAGDYFSDLGMRADGFGAGDWTALGIKLGAGTTSLDQGITVRGGSYINAFNRFKLPGLTTSEVLLLQAETSTSGGRIFEISFSLLPVRIS